MNERKRGILVVSFGTSHLDTLEKTIREIEKKIGDRWKEYRIYRAFTSGMIRNKLADVCQIYIDDVKGALTKMSADHISEVIVVPTHVIPGIENDKMEEEVRASLMLFDKVSIAQPLLVSASDFCKTAQTMMREIDPAEDEIVVFMGHGSDHPANGAYSVMEYAFAVQGFNRVIVGTVEGIPDIEIVRQKLAVASAVFRTKKIVLAPLMIVAGDHAKNDMAGDEEDSWKVILTNDGYDVRIWLKGMGELAGIQEIFMEHTEKVMRPFL